MSNSCTIETRSSSISINSETKYGKSRLNAGAKMFGDALRTIQRLENKKPSKKRSNSLNDARTENRVDSDLSDNLEITSQVASDNFDRQWALNNKNDFSIKLENRLHSHTHVNDESLCFTVRQSVSPTANSLAPESNDTLLQNSCSKYPLPNTEVEAQASRLYELSLFTENNPLSCDTDLNTADENMQKTSQFRPFYTKHTSQEDKFQNNRSTPSFKKNEKNNEKCNSLFRKTGNNNDECNSVFRNNTRNVSTQNTSPSKNNSFVFPPDDVSISHECSPYDRRGNETLEVSSIVSKQHTLSLNELCAPESFDTGCVEFSKPLTKSLKVKRSKYFIPQNFLDKSYDFPIPHSEYTSPLSSSCYFENNTQENSSQSISFKEFNKNVIQTDSALSGEPKLFTHQAITANSEQETSMKTLGKNSLPMHTNANSLDSKLVNDDKTHKESNVESSKGHHIPLSKIFGPPQTFDGGLRENIANCLNNNAVGGEELFNPKKISSVMESSYATLPVEYGSNATTKCLKTSKPTRKKFDSVYEVPPRFRNLPKYQNKPTEQTVSSFESSTHCFVQNFDSGSLNKVNPTVFRECSSPRESQNAPAELKNSNLQRNNSPLDYSKKYLCANKTHNKLDNLFEDRISLNNCASSPFSEINCDKNVSYKKPVPLNNCDIYNPSSSKFTPSSSNHAMIKDFAGTYDLNPMTIPTKEYFSHSSPHKNVPLSYNSAIMNAESVDLFDSNQIAIPIKEQCFSDSLLLAKSSKESQLLCNIKSNGSTAVFSTGYEEQLCENSSQHYLSETRQSISLQKYMKQQGFIIKCNTDFIVPPKFSSDSSGNLPLSSSVLEVIPDLLVANCLVDSFDESIENEVSNDFNDLTTSECLNKSNFHSESVISNSSTSCDSFMSDQLSIGPEDVYQETNEESSNKYRCDNSYPDFSCAFSNNDEKDDIFECPRCSCAVSVKEVLSSNKIVVPSLSQHMIKVDPGESLSTLDFSSDECASPYNTNINQSYSSHWKETKNLNSLIDRENYKPFQKDCTTMSSFNFQDAENYQRLPSYSVEQLFSFKTPGFFDSHCHPELILQRYNFRGSFADFRREHSSEFPPSYEGCVAIFCNPNSFNRDYLYEQHLTEENVWAAFGCHPKRANLYNDAAERALCASLRHPKVRALGEIGLDYSEGNYCLVNVQQTVFRRQLEIAVMNNLPLVIHCRDAYEDCLHYLRMFVPKAHKIHMHCFKSSWETANKFLTEFPNLCIGLTNTVTYSDSTAVHGVAAEINLDRLLLETDAPYFVPDVLSNRVNWTHPGHAIHVAAQVAAIRNISLTEVLHYARRNTKQLYNI